MNGLEVADPVQTFLRIKNGDECTISKVIDDDVFRRHCHEIRTALGGTKGMIRDKHGSAQAQLKYQIPQAEFFALLMQHDPDAEAWYRDRNDKAALRRLILRYPYWKVA